LPLMKRLSNTHRDNSNAIDPNLAIAD
jgi:hypothetical protein